MGCGNILPRDICVFVQAQWPAVDMPPYSGTLTQSSECSVMQLRTAQQLPYSDTCPRILAEFLHVKPGKGAAFVRSKLKNYLTGNTVEKTFRAGESVESALVERSPTQFTYADGDDVSSGADSSRWPLHGHSVLLWQTAPVVQSNLSLCSSSIEALASAAFCLLLLGQAAWSDGPGGQVREWQGKAPGQLRHSDPRREVRPT